MRWITIRNRNELVARTFDKNRWNVVRSRCGLVLAVLAFGRVEGRQVLVVDDASRSLTILRSLNGSLERRVEGPVLRPGEVPVDAVYCARRNTLIVLASSGKVMSLVTVDGRRIVSRRDVPVDAYRIAVHPNRSIVYVVGRTQWVQTLSLPTSGLLQSLGRTPPRTYDGNDVVVQPTVSPDGRHLYVAVSEAFLEVQHGEVQTSSLERAGLPNATHRADLALGERAALGIVFTSPKRGYLLGPNGSVPTLDRDSATGKLRVIGRTAVKNAAAFSGVYAPKPDCLFIAFDDGSVVSARITPKGFKVIDRVPAAADAVTRLCYDPSGSLLYSLTNTQTGAIHPLRIVNGRLEPRAVITVRSTNVVLAGIR